MSGRVRVSCGEDPSGRLEVPDTETKNRSAQPSRERTRLILVISRQGYGYVVMATRLRVSDNSGFTG